jgi:hypothetical protein
MKHTRPIVSHASPVHGHTTNRYHYVLTPREADERNERLSRARTWRGTVLARVLRPVAYEAAQGYGIRLDPSFSTLEVVEVLSSAMIENRVPLYRCGWCHAHTDASPSTSGIWCKFCARSRDVMSESIAPAPGDAAALAGLR